MRIHLRTPVLAIFVLALSSFSSLAQNRPSTATQRPAAQSATQSCNTGGRAIAMILDASGSMNAKLPNGETRIEVARRAVKGVVGYIAPQAQVSLRIYGGQSPNTRKNCQDSHLAVQGAAVSANSGAIAAAVESTKAQGYTPIAYSVQEAANDFPGGAKERVMVVVSDGKETCQGDPCAAAKALAAKGIVIHTVGFVVDTAARGQLQCMARATGGSYFDAPVGPELPETLKAAFAACKKTVVTIPPKPKPGKLRTTSAIFSHDVISAETGQKVGTLDRMSHQMELPAGIYEVKFGPGSWKGIEVRPGETTTIEPGVLRLEKRGGLGSIRVVDAETEESFGTFDAVTSGMTLMPGLYHLRFARGLEWRDVKVDGGLTTSLTPAEVVVAPGVKRETVRVHKDGNAVVRFDAVTSRAVLPPGDYVVEVDGNKFPFPATAGEVFEVKPQ